MKIKFFTLIALSVFLFFPQLTNANDGYKIKIHFTDVTDDAMLYLCNYFGEAGGKVYRIDSSILKNGVATFQSKEKIVGGIYMLLFKDQSSSMEVILLNGDDWTLKTKKQDLVNNMELTGRGENKFFYDYQLFLQGYGEGYKKLTNELATAKTQKDTTATYAKMRTKGKELTNYRRKFIIDHPGTFIATLFRAIEEPEVPEDWPTLEDGTKDSTFPGRYYAAHYWDDFNFKDDRIIYTPIYEPKLKNFLEKWMIPTPDSVKATCDTILKKTAGSEQLFKYSLWYLTRWAETSKIMGMDEVFVYLVEEYYMAGKATWLSKEDLKKYEDRAKAIAPNMLGQPAKDLSMRDTANNEVVLSKIKANYTILIFYDADCHHCKHELPLIDSLYKNGLAPYDVKIVAMEVTNDVEHWKKLINEKRLYNGWIHTYDPTVTTNYKSFYDAYVNPTIYLLDKNKKIVGKRINHSNILEVIQFLEKKADRLKKETTETADK